MRLGPAGIRASLDWRARDPVACQAGLERPKITDDHDPIIPPQITAALLSGSQARSKMRKPRGGRLPSSDVDLTCLNGAAARRLVVAACRCRCRCRPTADGPGRLMVHGVAWRAHRRRSGPALGVWCSCCLGATGSPRPARIQELFRVAHHSTAVGRTVDVHRSLHGACLRPGVLQSPQLTRPRFGDPP